MDASARANGSRFGLGGLVPGRVLGFGGRVRGVGGVTNGWETDKRMEDSESLNPLIR